MVSCSRTARALARAGCLLLCLAAHAPGRAAAGDAAERLVELGVDAEEARLLIERWEATPDAGPADSLVAVLEAIAARQAPMDLLVDKAAEGLAKRVPPAQVLQTLDRWGIELSLAAEVATRLHHRLDPGGVSLRETVLRVHLLQRSPDDDAWLRQLFRSAVDGRPEVDAFLGVAEAVEHLRRLGVGDESVHLGERWLAAGLGAGDVGDLVRAIDAAGDDSAKVEAARRFTERIDAGESVHDALAAPDAAAAGERRDVTDVDGGETPAHDPDDAVGGDSQESDR